MLLAVRTVTVIRVIGTYSVAIGATSVIIGDVVMNILKDIVFAASAGVASRTYKELCLMDDLGKLHIQKCSHICPKLLDDAREEGKEDILDNIYDHIPDDYGYCSDCERVNPDDGYGYCQDCEEHYSEDEIENIKEESKNEEYDRIIEQIETDQIQDSKLIEAIKKLVKREGGK